MILQNLNYSNFSFKGQILNLLIKISHSKSERQFIIILQAGLKSKREKQCLSFSISSPWTKALRQKPLLSGLFFQVSSVSGPLSGLAEYGPLVVHSPYTGWASMSPEELVENTDIGVSLEIQWLRVCLPMQGLRFDAWSGEIRHALGQPSPCARTPETWCARACARRHEKPPRWEACAPQLEKAHAQDKDPVQPEIKINDF